MENNYKMTIEEFLDITQNQGKTMAIFCKDADTGIVLCHILNKLDKKNGDKFFNWPNPDDVFEDEVKPVCNNNDTYFVYGKNQKTGQYTWCIFREDLLEFVEKVYGKFPAIDFYEVDCRKHIQKLMGDLIEKGYYLGDSDYMPSERLLHILDGYENKDEKEM